MRRHTSTAVALFVAATAALSTVSLSGAGQTKKPAPSAAAHPDLNGVWSYATATPLQRPKALAGKAVLTDREAADFEKTLASGGCRVLKCDGTNESKVSTAYDDVWWDFGDKLTMNRTS